MKLHNQNPNWKLPYVISIICNMIRLHFVINSIQHWVDNYGRWSLCWLLLLFGLCFLSFCFHWFHSLVSMDVLRTLLGVQFGNVPGILLWFQVGSKNTPFASFWAFLGLLFHQVFFFVCLYFFWFDQINLNNNKKNIGSKLQNDNVVYLLACVPRGHNLNDWCKCKD